MLVLLCDVCCSWNGWNKTKQEHDHIYNDSQILVLTSYFSLLATMCKDATRNIIVTSKKCPFCIDVALNKICLSTDKMSRQKEIVRKDINSCLSSPSGDNNVFIILHCAMKIKNEWMINLFHDIIFVKNVILEPISLYWTFW